MGEGAFERATGIFGGKRGAGRHSGHTGDAAGDEHVLLPDQERQCDPRYAGECVGGDRLAGHLHEVSSPAPGNLSKLPR